MKTSELINELASAFVKFQGEVPIIPFDKTVKVETKAGKSYSFKYASLKSIKEKCNPLLLKNGLAVTQLIGDKYISTILVHDSGQYIGESMHLPVRENMNPQEVGSVITYMKRYSYSAILGLVSDEDDDANIAQGNSVTKPDDQKKPQPTKKTDQTSGLIQLKKDDSNWKKCVVYLTQGGSKPEDLKKKYRFTPETQVKLMQDVDKLKNQTK